MISKALYALTPPTPPSSSPSFHPPLSFNLHASLSSHLPLDFSDTLSILPSQGLCIFYSLCLEHSCSLCALDYIWNKYKSFYGSPQNTRAEKVVFSLNSWDLSLSLQQMTSQDLTLTSVVNSLKKPSMITRLFILNPVWSQRSYYIAHHPKLADNEKY